MPVADPGQAVVAYLSADRDFVDLSSPLASYHYLPLQLGSQVNQPLFPLCQGERGLFGPGVVVALLMGDDEHVVLVLGQGAGGFGPTEDHGGIHAGECLAILRCQQYGRRQGFWGRCGCRLWRGVRLGSLGSCWLGSHSGHRRVGRNRRVCWTGSVGVGSFWKRRVRGRRGRCLGWLFGCDFRFGWGLRLGCWSGTTGNQQQTCQYCYKDQ